MLEKAAARDPHTAARIDRQVGDEGARLGEGPRSGVLAIPFAQAACRIAEAIGTETWPPVWPRPRVLRVPSALS